MSLRNRIQIAGGAVTRRLRGELGTMRDSVSGALSVELALAVAAMLVLGLGSYDFGRFAISKARLSNAAHAGAVYGIQDASTSGDISGIELAARTDAADNQLAVTSRLVCICAADGEVACGGTCSDGLAAPIYVEVTVQDTLDFLFSYPGIADSLNLSSTAQIRYR